MALHLDLQDRYRPRVLTVLEDEAPGASAYGATHTWWLAVENAARQFLHAHPWGTSPLVVYTGADGTPARVDLASRDDWPDLTLWRLRSQGPVVARLSQLLSEVQALQAVIAEGSSFDLEEVAGALRSVIDVGEPAVRGPLPDRHELVTTGSTHEAEKAVAPGGEDDLRGARQRLEELLSQHHSARHPEVIDQWMEVAELTEKRGEPRAAIALFEQLATELRDRLGRIHSRTLDAYEGVARWVGAQGRA